jgi:hypothetical protein
MASRRLFYTNPHQIIITLNEHLIHLEKYLLIFILYIYYTFSIIRTDPGFLAEEFIRVSLRFGNEGRLDAMERMEQTLFVVSFHLNPAASAFLAACCRVSERVMFKIPSLGIGDSQELAPENLQFPRPRGIFFSLCVNGLT